MKDFNMINKTLRKGALATVAAGGLVLAASAAQAAPVFFAPGTADGGAPTYGNIAAPSAATDVLTRVDIFRWEARNNQINTGPATNPGAQGFNTWNIVINNDGTFTETFTFLLLRTENTANSTSTTYGNPSTGNLDGSYVSMVVDVNGTVNDINASTENLQFTYTGGTFDWFFHSDGLADDCSVACASTQIASFDLESGSGTPVANQQPDRWDLEWSALIDTLDDPGTIQDSAGNDIDNPSTDIEFKFTNQQIQLVDDIAAVGDGPRTLVVGRLPAGTTVFTAIPEPGTLALFGIGLLGVGLTARRRRKAAA